MASLREHVGQHLGYTEWSEMDQERVDRFADVTDDHNYIHVDVERAKASPFGGTIAHGYLILSLLAPITMGLLQVTDATTAINYGLDRVRFPAPLPVGRSGAVGESWSRWATSAAASRSSSGRSSRSRAPQNRRWSPTASSACSAERRRQTAR